MYCGEFLHDNVSPVKSLEELQQYWTQVFEKTKHLDKRYKISFTGGEVTINKNFKPFVHWLKENFAEQLDSVRLTSNGSASKNYYLGVLEDLSSLTLSTHSESMDVDAFIDKAIACNDFVKQNPSKFFMVNIMEEYWAVDTIKRLVDAFNANGIRFSINKIDYSRKGARNFPIFVANRVRTPRHDLEFSQDKIDQAHKTIQDYVNIHTIPRDEFYNITVEYDNGETDQTYATRLNFLKLNCFTGWNCYAGAYRINIASNGQVYSGECYNDDLGSLVDGSFQIRSEPTICKLATCTGNPDDIMMHKSTRYFTGKQQAA